MIFVRRENTNIRKKKHIHVITISLRLPWQLAFCNRYMNDQISAIANCMKLQITLANEKQERIVTLGIIISGGEVEVLATLWREDLNHIRHKDC